MRCIIHMCVMMNRKNDIFFLILTLRLNFILYLEHKTYTIVNNQNDNEKK